MSRRCDKKDINKKLTIAIDGDSFLYIATYRSSENDLLLDTEMAIFHFEQLVWDIYLKFRFFFNNKMNIDYVIILSPKKTFRNRIYPEYKANRKGKSMDGIETLKRLISRQDNAYIFKDVEADDVVIMLANKYNYLVASKDKDVLMASPTIYYNINTKKIYPPRDEWQIERWYWVQALAGDGVDNIKGGSGYGMIRAKKKIEKDYYSQFSWDNFANCFESEEEAILSMRLVRMDQYTKKGEIKLWEKIKSKWIR